jgi:hypothetical protein
MSGTKKIGGAKRVAAKRGDITAEMATDEVNEHEELRKMRFN